MLSMARHSFRRRVAHQSFVVRLLAVPVLLTVTWLWLPTVSTVAASNPGTDAWTVYHGDTRGTGLSTTVRAVDTRAPVWTSPILDGQLYGEPLIWSGAVYVATEHDTIYALSAATGAVRWAKHVGQSVASSALPCGNIAPEVGITGTPVIDQARNELFVVAELVLHGTPVHVLYGLNATTGALEMRRRVDPPGSDSAALLQRTGLTIDAGRVVFGFGGLYGDCGRYRGTVMSVAESRGPTWHYLVDGGAGQSQGAVWMGGAAPVIDARGNVWVSTGNGSSQASSAPYDHSDAVLDLSARLHLRQYFAPSDWASNNASDLDMSMPPALLANGEVVVAGKSRIAYLLNATHLGGIGHEVASLESSCPQEIIGGSAVRGRTVYLPCLGGISAVRVGPTSPLLHLLWSSSHGGGPPIVAGRLVWTIGADGVLYGLSESAGALRQRATLGVAANHFPTPSVGGGLLVATSTDRVIAFATTPG